MLGVKTCCWQCEKRAVGCRETCEKWAEYEKQKAERYARRTAEYQGGYGVSDSPRLKKSDKARTRNYMRGYK